jgi:hypothetical protein
MINKHHITNRFKLTESKISLLESIYDLLISICEENAEN